MSGDGRMRLVEKLEQYRREERELAWGGTFAEYFELAVTTPRVAQLSHARVYEMLMAAGAGGRNGQRAYGFFAGELFGVEPALQQLVEYFSSAARRLEVRKRILLLMGPVGGGQVDDRLAAQAGAGAVDAERGRGAVRDRGVPDARGALAPGAGGAAGRGAQGVRALRRGGAVPGLPERAAGALRGPARGRAGRAGGLLGEEPARDRDVLALGPQEPGHQRADRLDRPGHDRGVRGRVGPAGLPLRRRAQRRQPGADGVRRDAQVRREVPVLAA